MAGLKALVSGGLLFWAISRIEFMEIIDALLRAQMDWLLMAACLPAVGILLISARWGGLLRAQGISVSPGFLVQSCIVAGFFRQFLPTTIGGDALRGYDSWKVGASKTVAFTTLVADRLLGLLALVIFALIALFVEWRLTQDYPFLYLVMLAGLTILVVSSLIFVPLPGFIRNGQWLTDRLPAKIQSLSEKVFSAVTAYQGKTPQLTRAFLISLALQVNVITFYFFVGKAMGFEIPYYLYFLIVPIAVLVMLVPITINGIGIRENIFVLLLGMFAIGEAEAIAFAWLEHGLFLFYGLVGSAVFAFRRSPQQLEKAVRGDL